MIWPRPVQGGAFLICVTDLGQGGPRQAPDPNEAQRTETRTMGRIGSFFCLAPHSVKREAEEDWTLIKQNPRRSLRRFFIQRAKLVGGVPTNSAYCTSRRHPF